MRAISQRRPVSRVSKRYALSLMVNFAARKKVTYSGRDVLVTTKAEVLDGGMKEPERLYKQPHV